MLIFNYYYFFFVCLFVIYSEEAIKCCNDEEAFKVFNQLKEPNKSVLGYLACFVSHVSTFAAETGVNDNALANVFSPCIMKCPYTDIKEMIAATEKQTFFVLGLLDAAKNGLITSEEFKLSLANAKHIGCGPAIEIDVSVDGGGCDDDDDDDSPPPIPSCPPPPIPFCPPQPSCI